MRVLMLSDNESMGGAAIAASRLAAALVDRGLEVIRAVGRADGHDHPWATRTLVTWREQVLMRALGRISERLRMVVVGRVTGGRLKRLLDEVQPDVANIHNLHNAGWSAELVAVCARHAPTVWTLHDMWSFTGRCAYSYDCRQFISGCDAACPTSAEYPPLSPRLIAGAWKRRGRLFAACADLVAVCPSNWLAQDARAGFWAGHRVEVIPYGLPLDIYVPTGQALGRGALGVNSTGPVLLAAAQDLNERRKGGAILVQALQKVRHRPFTLMTLGHGHLPVAAEGVGLHSLGYVDHERTRVLAYNAADLLVHPAPVDNLPIVVLEAIACGTPCVGFEVGGVPDMVRPGVTGWLAQDMTADALATAIEDALATIEEGTDLGSSCRAIAESEYAAEIQAQRYLTLFGSLL